MTDGSKLHILAATDFSDANNIAVNYACHLASAYAASLTVMHAYIVPVAFNDAPMPVMPVEDGQKIAEDRMAESLQQLRTFYPELDVEGKVVYGNIVDAIQDYSEHNPKPWLVVFANTGDTSLFADNDALAALRHLSLPVLAVPATSVYRPLQKVCFAFDSKLPLTALPVQELSSLLAPLNVEMHILNVASATAEDDLAHAESTRQLHKALDSLHPNYHFIAGSDIDESIRNFVETNHIDWLILAPQKHSFFEGLLHKSHTATMVRTSQIPLVALHQNSSK